MKDGFIKTACTTPELKVADCIYNTERIIEHGYPFNTPQIIYKAIQINRPQNSGNILFPQLNLAEIKQHNSYRVR